MTVEFDVTAGPNAGQTSHPANSARFHDARCQIQKRAAAANGTAHAAPTTFNVIGGTGALKHLSARGVVAYDPSFVTSTWTMTGHC